MNILVHVIVPLLGSYFLLFCLLWGMRQIGGKTQRLEKKQWVLAILFCTAIVGLSVLGNMVINLITILLIPFFAQYLNGTGKISLIRYFVLVVLVYLLDILVSLGWTMLVGNGLLYLNAPELYVLSTNLTVRLSQFLAVRLVVLLTRRTQGGHITGKQLMEAMVLPIFSIFNVLVLIYLMQIYLTVDMLVLFLVDVIVLIGINIWFAVLIDTMSENNRLEKEVGLLKQRAEFEMGYYRREEEKYEESRKLIHDIRNHILALEQLCQGEEKKEAMSYATNLHEMLNGLGQTYYTAERLLNIILNDKAAELRKAGIREDIKVGDVDLRFMQDTDITTIFANLLDNAITAAGDASEGFVKLRVKQVNRFVSVSVENSAPKEPVSGKNGFISSKVGHEGLGLKNVSQAVARYNGDLQYEWKEGIFTVSLLISMPEEEEE